MPTTSTPQSFDEAIDWLFQQFPSYQVIGSKAFKPTLQNSERILNYLSHPEDGLTFIHVAGSNGKGSVSCYLASILKEAGHNVGLFTSPHIVHFSERIRVNGNPISEEKIAHFVTKIQQAPLDFSPSFFEITFGMALEHFKEEKCNICIIETGLGGRLDATNVITPKLSIITSISLEHTDMLGDSLEEIAAEKAGIIKNTVPVVVGQGCKLVYSVFETKADETYSKLIKADSSSTFDGYFKAPYQRENFACVIAALETLKYAISKEQVIRGIEKVGENAGYVGRLQLVQQSPTIIFDVAHNPDGIRHTIDIVSRELRGELFIIYGSSKDKDVKNILPLFPSKTQLLATEFKNQRSMKVADFKVHLDGTNFKSVDYYKEAAKALQVAKDRASKEDTILVLGSFFLLSDFF